MATEISPDEAAGAIDRNIPESTMLRTGRAPTSFRGQPRFPWSSWPVRILLIVVLVGLDAWWLGVFDKDATPPRQSVVIFPLTADDAAPELVRFSDRLCDQVMVDLAQLWNADVASRDAMQGFRGRPDDARAVGRWLHVRYVVQASLQRTGDTLRLTASILSGETGDVLRRERFDAPRDNDGVDDEVRAWMTGFVGNQLLIADNARSARQQPEALDALDFILQGKALLLQQPDPARSDLARELFDKALRLDRNSFRAMIGWITVASEQFATLRRPVIPADFSQADHLMSIAEAIAPTDDGVMFTRGYLLRQQERWAESAAALERVVKAYPQDGRAAFYLGSDRLRAGQPEQAIPWLQTAIHLDPRGPDLWVRDWELGKALAIAGRYDEALTWLQRVEAAGPPPTAFSRSLLHLWLASTYALARQVDQARDEVATALHIQPYYWSVRSAWAGENSDPGLVGRLDRLRDGLRMAGLRDHVLEDESGPKDAPPGLHMAVEGLTPEAIPGGRVVRTSVAAELLASGGAVVLDGGTGVQSVKGAKSMAWIGSGGTLADGMQEVLRGELDSLTRGNMARPIVVLGINAEHWGGYDLALRVIALGYSNVLWYRGGRDAWSAAALPMTMIRSLPAL